MKRTCLQLTTLLGFAVLLLGSVPAMAQTAPSLGSAGSFAVLGGSTVTNTGSSVITGDLGVSPGSAVTGFPPGVVVGGTIHEADAVALAAQSAVTTAYNALAAQACTQDLTGQDLGGLTLTPGVYCFSSSAQLTGTLTLNAQGDSNAVFIFKIGSTLTTASGSSVSIINGTVSSLCNVFWQVGSSATLGTGSALAGNILALTSITLTTGATVTGRTLARNGAVTLDSNTVSAAACTASVPPPGCPVVTFSPATLPNGTVGVAYAQTLTGSGGLAPYIFTVVAGALPAGLTLTPAGSLSGTPTTAGSTSVTIRVIDANNCFADRVLTMVIAAATCPVVTFNPATLPNATVGDAYTQTLTGSGGTAPYTFAVTVGTLPAGLTLTAAGALSGTPTTAGSSEVTIRVTDANNCFADRVLTIAVTTAVPTLPQAFVALLGVGLAGVGYHRLRRRARRQL
ncbi:MAG: ice-binding family protein [Vicinamibacterales bacterium]